VLVRRRDGKARGHQALSSLGGIWGLWSAKPRWQRRVPSQPLGQDGHSSTSLVFKCGGSFQPWSEGSLRTSFSCFLQGTSKWAVKYCQSRTPEILPRPHHLHLLLRDLPSFSASYFPPDLRSVPWGFWMLFTGSWG